jgi:hypothetical protein
MPQWLGAEQGRRPRLRRAALMTAGMLAVAACNGGASAPEVADSPTNTTPKSASGPLLPTADPFYRWTGSLAGDAPGTILRARTLTIAFAEGGGATTPVKTTQLLYVTTNELGRRTASVTTVFHPLHNTSSAATRVVSYQTAYDTLGAQCDPSYTIQAGTLGEPGLILGYVATGYTLVISDYEGEDHALGAGQQYGYETLDAIRAAEKSLGVAEVSTPVGMLGYSGGSTATEFASELAPTYAPQLDIVGAAAGGVPVDLFHNLAYVDHPGSGRGSTIPVFMDGLSRAFEIRDLDQYLTRQGIAVVNANKAQCSGGFTGLTTEQMFKPPYRDISKVPALARMLNKLIMGRTGTPRGPLLLGVGLSDSIGDGVIVAKDVQGLAYTYCQRGVPVEFHIYNGSNHSQAGGPFFQRAEAFLAQRFENQQFQSGCAHIGPGNSLSPVPVPAS